MVGRPHINVTSYGVLTRGSGVFTTTAKATEVPFSPIDVSSSETTMGDSIEFSLSKGNSIYSGSSLQPASAHVLMIIKV